MQLLITETGGTITSDHKYPSYSSINEINKTNLKLQVEENFSSEKKPTLVKFQANS